MRTPVSRRGKFFLKGKKGGQGTHLCRDKKTSKGGGSLVGKREKKLRRADGELSMPTRNQRTGQEGRIEKRFSDGCLWRTERKRSQS